MNQDNYSDSEDSCESTQMESIIAESTIALERLYSIVSKLIKLGIKLTGEDDDKKPEEKTNQVIPVGIIGNLISLQQEQKKCLAKIEKDLEKLNKVI